DARPKVYVVLNGKLVPYFQLVRASTLPIVTRSFETSVRANTRNTLFASYQFAKNRNWDFKLASVDASFPNPPSNIFDPSYMQALFDHGYQRGKSGIIW